MPTIKISRVNEFVNKQRNIKLYVDGKEIGVLANGERGVFQVSDGAHTLQAKIDWCTSPVINLNLSGNESMHYQLSSFMHNSAGNSFSEFALRLIHITAGAFYYTTFGKNQYLVLTEK